MKFDIENAIKQSTLEDGKLDTNKLMGLIDNDYVNPIVASNKTKFDEKAKKEFIENLGLENIANEEELKQYISQNVDEAKNQYTEIKSKYEDLQKKYNDYEQDYSKAKSRLTEYERKDMLLKDNFNGDVDYALFLINREVSEEKPFDDVYKEFKESNPKNFAPNRVGTMAKKVGNQETPEKEGWEVLLEEKHPELKN